MKKTLITLTVSFAILCGAFSCKSQKKVATSNVHTEFETKEVWELVSIRGKQVKYSEDQRHITIQFNPEAGTVNGCSGCNRYFGNYQSSPDGKMTLSEMNGTKMACPEPFMKLERQYMPILQKVDGYRLGEYTLELLQKENIVLVFEKETH